MLERDVDLHYLLAMSVCLSVRLSVHLSVCLSVCHVPRMNYLARCVAPSFLTEASQVHDRLSRSTFSKILALNSIDDTAWQQASLKIKSGGFGISLLSQISTAAFVAAWIHSISEIPK